MLHVCALYNSGLGLFQSISLRNQDALQDTLRLLTLWFNFGSHENVSNAMTQGFAKVGIDTWLHVIPQVKSWFLYTLQIFINFCVLDYCPYPNSKPAHPEDNPQCTHQYRQTSPSSSHLPAYCGSEIIKRNTCGCRHQYHERNAGS